MYVYMVNDNNNNNNKMQRNVHVVSLMVLDADFVMSQVSNCLAFLLLCRLIHAEKSRDCFDVLMYTSFNNNFEGYNYNNTEYHNYNLRESCHPPHTCLCAPIVHVPLLMKRGVEHSRAHA